MQNGNGITWKQYSAQTIKIGSGTEESPLKEISFKTRLPFNHELSWKLHNLLYKLATDKDSLDFREFIRSGFQNETTERRLSVATFDIGEAIQLPYVKTGPEDQPFYTKRLWVFGPGAGNVRKSSYVIPLVKGKSPEITRQVTVEFLSWKDESAINIMIVHAYPGPEVPSTFVKSFRKLNGGLSSEAWRQKKSEQAAFWQKHAFCSDLVPHDVRLRDLGDVAWLNPATSTSVQ